MLHRLCRASGTLFLTGSRLELSQAKEVLPAVASARLPGSSGPKSKVKPSARAPQTRESSRCDTDRDSSTFSAEPPDPISGGQLKRKGGDHAGRH